MCNSAKNIIFSIKLLVHPWLVEFVAFGKRYRHRSEGTCFCLAEARVCWISACSEVLTSENADAANMYRSDAFCIRALC